jgi:oligopeptide transport system substrate-binding protein
MRKVKWIFFGYLAACLLVLVGIAGSFAVTRQRDPGTSYGAYGENLKTLDPAECSDEGVIGIDGYVYECLYNYAYGVDQYRLEPELADGDPLFTPDQKTLTIKVKPGVHFYDPDHAVWSDGVGPEVTAADVVYSWKRVCNFHLGVTANYAMVFQGHVVGIDDWFNYTQSCAKPADIDWDKPVAGLAAVDRYTLRIKLVDPFPQLTFELATMGTAVVSRDAVQHWGDHFKNHPVGTGAYALSQHLPDQQIVFTANPVYRGGSNVRSGTQLSDAERLPHVKRVQLNYFSEELPPWYLFLEGRLDAGTIPKDTFGQAIAGNSASLTPEMQRDGILLEKSADPWVTYLLFNMADPVVGKNKALRQAMSLAYDRQLFIDRYLNGRGVPANGPIPPGLPSYDPQRVAPFCRFDLAAARAKMAEAVAANGGQPIPPVHVVFGDTSSSTTQEGDFIVTQMRQIGLTVLTDYKPYPEFLSMLDRKQAQMYVSGWVADYPDEQDYWQLFYGPNATPGGLNPGSYSNPEFDKLYERSSAMPPSPVRAALYKRMQDIVLDECPYLFMYYPISFQLYHDWRSKPWLSDYGYGFAKYTTLDSAARSKWLMEH